MAIYVRELTREELATLTDLVDDPHTPSRIAFRARIVLLSHQGHRVSQIAQMVGASPLNVWMRVRRFNAEGLEGLYDLPRPGRPRIYGPVERKTVVTLAGTDPATLGLSIRVWTLIGLREYLRSSSQMPNIGYETIRRILHANGVALKPPTRITKSRLG